MSNFEQRVTQWKFMFRKTESEKEGGYGKSGQRQRT